MNHDSCGFDVVIPGDGPTNAAIMIIGEAAGDHEEWQQRPFVGRSGLRLNHLLGAFLGMGRADVYVTNAFKHHPPRNRNPKRAELLSCLPNLQDEVDTVKPIIVVTLGAIPLSLVAPELKISKCHGAPFRYGGGSPLALAEGTIVVPWYHPAASFRSAKYLKDSAVDASSFWELLENVDYAPVFDYQLATPADAVYEILDGSPFGFDLETTSETGSGRRTFKNIVGFSVSTKAFRGLYIPHQPDVIKAQLQDPRHKVICHNVKFEYHRLLEHGITLTNYEDTRGLGFLMGYSDTTLKGLTQQLLHIKPATFDETTAGIDLADPTAMRRAMIDNHEYGAADADNAHRLYDMLLTQVRASGMESVYRDIELPLVPTLVDMERTGIGVDGVKVVELLAELTKRCRQSCDFVWNLMGDKPNLNSGAQVAQTLLDLGAPLTVRTPTGQYSTSAEVLEKIRKWNPMLIDTLLQYKQHFKMQAFLRSFLTLQGDDGRIHPSYNQFGSGYEEVGGDGSAAPETGRLSSSSPNAQNIPNYGEWGKKIRSCLLPGDGYLWLKCDFAQEEPRITAMVSGDKALQQDFIDGVDVYTAVAAALYDVEYDSVQKRQRDVAKRFFLLWVYGGRENRAVQLDRLLTLERAFAGLQRLRNRYPDVSAYADKMREFVVEHGYVETLFGRRRYITEIYMADEYARQEGYRKATNTPIQGTGADVIKLMLQRVNSRLDRTQADILTTVHDELDLRVRPEYALTAARIVKEEADRVLPGLPLPVEFELGDTWGQLTKWEPVL